VNEIIISNYNFNVKLYLTFILKNKKYNPSLEGLLL